MKLKRKYFINFYTLFGLFAFVWMMFLDSNDILTVAKKRARNRKNQKQITYYKNKIAEDKSDYNSFIGDPKETERFGRENYNMKKESEDIYLIVEDED